MLVLSRHANESIMIGADVKVTILRISGDNVIVGVAAPKHVAVDREEIFLKKQQEGTQHDAE